MSQASHTIDPNKRCEELAASATEVLRLCRENGASQAELTVSEDAGLAVHVRMGEVETIEQTHNKGLSLTVYFGQKKAHASTADLKQESLLATVQQACAIARYTEADAASGLAEAGEMAREIAHFDCWHPWSVDAERAIELALQSETAGRDTDKRISNSDGASVNTGHSLSVYANSHGFVGPEYATHHSLSCALIAGKNGAMQRDYWYTTSVIADEMESAKAVGQRAAERTLSRLSPRKPPTGEVPILFVPDIARSLIGHLLSAISGGALYRKASFLLNSVGQKLFPDGLEIVEHPHLLRAQRSAAFDGDGLPTKISHIVQNGQLQRYVLSTYSARRLGLQSTANAGGVHNVLLTPNAGSLDDIRSRMTQGLIVTELMGQGVNGVTGDYSRGAAGFWVENGEIAYPVDEVTIAGNLRDMFQRMEACGNDIDTRGAIRTGSILISKMMVAGTHGS